MRKVNSVQQLVIDEVETPPSPDDAVLVEDNVYEVFEYDFSTYSYTHIYKILYNRYTLGMKCYTERAVDKHPKIW